MSLPPPKPPRLRAAAPPPPLPATPVAPVVVAAEPPPPPAPPIPPAPPAAADDQPVHPRRPWFAIGAQGLLTSLFVHALLLIIATVWVVSVSLNEKRDPNAFVTGAGGGQGGDRFANTQHKVKHNSPKTLTKAPTRIISKNPASSIGLPEMPNPAQAGLTSIGGPLAKGFGSGHGGGAGGGLGAGTGGAKNFVGRPVMGMRIAGARIAVYFDDSPSMTPYLDGVEKQIKEQFPQADVFRYYGIFCFIEDGEIVGSDAAKKYQIPTVEQLVAQRRIKSSPALTILSKLSPTGKSIFTSHDINFRMGGVGAWVNYMQTQNYDALVIFSDFQDGVQQFRLVKESRPKLVYDPDQYPPFEERTVEEKAWETRWIRQFQLAAVKKAPRLYIYSTAQQPQPIYQLCVMASGGDFKMIELPKAGPRPLRPAKKN